MVIKLLKVKSIVIHKSEYYSPVFFNSKAPVTLPISFKRMNFPAFEKFKIMWNFFNAVYNFQYLSDFIYLVKRQL